MPERDEERGEEQQATSQRILRSATIGEAPAPGGGPPLRRRPNPPRAAARYDPRVTRRAPPDLSSAAQEYLLALRVAEGDGCRVTTAHIARQVGVTTQAASENTIQP